MSAPNPQDPADGLLQPAEKKPGGEPTGMDILREWSAPHVTFAPNKHGPPPTSFPATREQHIKDIPYWVSPPPGIETFLPMYWMKGEKGVGKSMVVQNCVKKLKNLGHIVAAFSFDACDDHSHFFPSIAYQLSTEFSDYGALLEKKIRLDGSLIRKAMKVQFTELIVEPLQELKKSGKEVGRKAIFIDGLNECKDTAAQCEIIEIIAASIREPSTPFLWAFFSRPEPHIVATFAKPSVASFCHSTLLPVSCGANKEIELYLQNGLQNVNRRVTSDHPGPSERDLKTLVDAANGHFIYAATILRLMNQPGSLHGQEELLRSILNTAVTTLQDSRSPSGGPTADEQFTHLDGLYALILQRAQPELLTSIQFLLANLTISIQSESYKDDLAWSTVELSNRLRFSEANFKRLYGELQAVLFWGNVSHPDFDCLESLAISIHDEKLAHVKTAQLIVLMLGGYLVFHDKSFYDFLVDPKRSGGFCVETQAMKQRIFEHHIQLHLKLSQNYYIQNRDLVPVPRTHNAPTGLSWSHRAEFINSYIKITTFNKAGGIWLHTCFPFDGVAPQVLKRLAELDHRKYLLSQPYGFQQGVLSSGVNFGGRCLAKNVRGTMLCRIAHADFHHFDVDKFYRGIARLEESKVIQPYFPDLASRLKGLFDRSQNASPRRLYTKGYGSKKTFGFWELNLELGYYQHFETVDLAEGEKIYREENFNLWKREALPGLESQGEESMV